MDWQGWFTLAIVFLVICGMVSEYGGPDFVIGAGLCSLAAAGILSPRETFWFREPVPSGNWSTLRSFRWPPRNGLDRSVCGQIPL